MTIFKYSRLPPPPTQPLLQNSIKHSHSGPNVNSLEIYVSVFSFALEGDQLSKLVIYILLEWSQAVLKGPRSLLVMLMGLQNQWYWWYWGPSGWHLLYLGASKAIDGGAEDRPQECLHAKQCIPAPKPFIYLDLKQVLLGLLFGSVGEVGFRTYSWLCVRDHSW